MTRLDLGHTLARKKGGVLRTVSLALLVSSGFLSPRAQAQTSEAGPTLGQIIGQDVSVLGPSQAAPNSPVPAIEFSGGSTVVVHSGKARIDFVGGGVVDVCGPAKFTVLSSGEALTIALSFGRVHLRVDASRPMVIYSPLVLATPVPIGDRARDSTVGLSNHGALCVLASSGAVRLQNQLSGETVIVPQPAEVLVPGASLTNLLPATGQCRCEFDERAARRSAPATEPAASPLHAASVPGPESKPPAARSLPANPVLPGRPAAPVASAPPSWLPPAAGPAAKINLPPIGYEATSGTTAAEPLSVATLLLAQQAVVRPEWTFQGTVAGSGNPSNLAPSAGPTAARPPGPASPDQPQPKKGFWARLRAFITGSH